MKDLVDQIVDGVIRYLKARKAMEVLPSIIEKLQSHVQTTQETARIISAVALSIEEKTMMKEYIKKTFGKDINAEVFVDPSIMGGFVIRIGDEVIDESIQGKLKKLSEKLKD